MVLGKVVGLIAGYKFFSMTTSLATLGMEVEVKIYETFVNVFIWGGISDTHSTNSWKVFSTKLYILT
jgi:hypothetical protein